MLNGYMLTITAFIPQPQSWQRPCGSQSWRYLLSGPLQKKSFLTLLLSVLPWQHTTITREDFSKVTALVPPTEILILLAWGVAWMSGFCLILFFPFIIFSSYKKIHIMFLWIIPIKNEQFTKYHNFILCYSSQQNSCSILPVQNFCPHATLLTQHRTRLISQYSKIRK